MHKNRNRPGESIEEQEGETVCAGFAFSCHFLSHCVHYSHKLFKPITKEHMPGKGFR
jgi:hypothetical protein